MYDTAFRTRCARGLLFGVLLFLSGSGLVTAADRITAVTVSADAIRVQVTGKPAVATLAYGRPSDYYFIVSLAHSILAGRPRTISLPGNSSATVTVAQYTLNPAVVRLVVHSGKKIAMPIRTRHQEHDRYQVALLLHPRPPLKVFLDVGHGGYDPGGTGPDGLPESFVNLDVAKRVAKLLRSKGIEVELDRTGNAFVSLAHRVALANESGADLFLGLYCNASSDRAVHGTTTYYYHPNSYRFASYLEKHVADSLGLSDDGVMRDNLYVIRYTTTRMPAVLIEYAYISNVPEELMLTRSSFRGRVASAVAGAVTGYFERHPQIQSSSPPEVSASIAETGPTNDGKTAQIDAVETGDGTVTLHAAGKPTVGSFSMNRGGIRYYVVNLENAVLAGHARSFQMGPPFSGRVTVDQFSVRPDVVRISVREDYDNTYGVSLDKVEGSGYVATIYPRGN